MDSQKWKKTKKTIVSFVVLVAMMASVVGVNPTSVKAVTPRTATYPYAYTIRNFLSDYQYVAKGDLVSTNHTVGGVVSGGNLTLGSFGEAMIMPGYAKHVISTGNLNVTKYEGVPSGYACNTFYYDTMENGAVPNYLSDNFIKGEYINVVDAYTSLDAESAQMANHAEATPTISGDTLIVDFSKASSYRIDASLLEKNGTSKVNMIGVDSVDEFIDKEYSISFTGIGDNSLYLDYVWGSNKGYDYYVHLLFHGNKFEQEMKKISTENYAGSQFANSGMKFITNVPDATELVANGLSGHLVAPKAAVTITGGDFEGGVIAGSVSANVEGHFYPYYKIGSARVNAGSEVELEDIGGKIIISQRECSTLKENLKYDYTVKPGTKAYLESLDTKDTIYYYVDTTGSSKALTTSELDGKSFTLYDPSNPPVLGEGKTVIYEKVIDDKNKDRYVYVNSEALAVKPAKEIVETKVDLESVYVGEPVEIIQIKDIEDQMLIVSPENATFQWQVYDETTSTWKNIPGANSYVFTPDETLEAQKIRCEVKGTNGYTGTATDESVVRALSPVPVGRTDTSITIEAEDGFEYQILDKDGNVIQTWVEDGESDDADSTDNTITFDGLTPSTEYDIVKRKVDTPETESHETNAKTITTIVKAELFPAVVPVGDTMTLIGIEDVNGKSVEVNTENATYQWQVFDEGSGTWNDISGATSITYVPDASKDGKQVRCEVTGINTYTGTAYAQGTVQSPKEIVETNVDKEAVYIGQPIVVDTIKDKDGNLVTVNTENADFQWQVYDEETGTWKDIPGQTTASYTPDDSVEGEQVRCEVTGKNDYTGVVTDNSIVKANKPVPVDATDTTITIEAEEDFEYKLVDKNGTVIQDWVKDGDSEDADQQNNTITFDGLTPSTEYNVYKRKENVPETESLEATAATVQLIVLATLSPEVSAVGNVVTLSYIEDVQGNPVTVNTTNATYQWQAKVGDVWTDVSGATAITFTVPENFEGKEIRCHVTGINTYGGEAYAQGVVKALPPVGQVKTGSSITIEAEEDFEYEIRKPDGTVVISWTKPNGKTTITFDGLTPETEYDIVKRTPGLPKTESDVTTIKTAKPGETIVIGGKPGTTPMPSGTPAISAPGVSSSPNGIQTPQATATPNPNVMYDPEDPTAPFIKKDSIELKIPTIVMKKVMGPKMKFKIKLLNQKGARVRCESSNKKLATINKKGLVKTKKKTGKCKLIINVSKGERRIQYIVNLVVRKSCKKNYSLYKYKTSYKSPSVSLYKLIPMGKKYKVQLKHLSKDAKVSYKSSKPGIATVNKKGKVTPKKNGRADITINIKQNGVTYRYFVVVRVTQEGVESNTSYLKVIK